MRRPPLRAHRAPDQTDPSFFADIVNLPSGSAARGCFTQWVMNMTLGGECDLWLDGREERARPGVVMLIRSGTEIRQAVPAAVEHWRVAYTVFYPRPHWLAWLQFSDRDAGHAVIRLEDGAVLRKVRRLMLTCCKLYASGAQERNALAMLALERLILTLRVHRHEQESDPRVNSAIELMNADYAHEWTVEQLAEACHASASHLSALFQSTIGVAPIQYLEQVRMQRALEMLALSQVSIEEIARNVGYRYPSYFARRFKRHTGQTPWEYRRRVREN